MPVISLPVETLWIDVSMQRMTFSSWNDAKVWWNISAVVDGPSIFSILCTVMVKYQYQKFAIDKEERYRPTYCKLQSNSWAIWRHEDDQHACCLLFTGTERESKVSGCVHLCGSSTDDDGVLITDSVRKHHLAIRQLQNKLDAMGSDSSSFDDGGTDDATQMTKQLVQMARNMEGEWVYWIK